jgi:hypothetical protein
MSIILNSIVHIPKLVPDLGITWYYTLFNGNEEKKKEIIFELVKIKYDPEDYEETVKPSIEDNYKKCEIIIDEFKTELNTQKSPSFVDFCDNQMKKYEEENNFINNFISVLISFLRQYVSNIDILDKYKKDLNTQKSPSNTDLEISLKKGFDTFNMFYQPKYYFFNELLKFYPNIFEIKTKTEDYVSYQLNINQLQKTSIPEVKNLETFDTLEIFSEDFLTNKNLTKQQMVFYYSSHIISEYINKVCGEVDSGNEVSIDNFLPMVSSTSYLIMVLTSEEFSNNINLGNFYNLKTYLPILPTSGDYIPQIYNMQKNLHTVIEKIYDIKTSSDIPLIVESEGTITELEMNCRRQAPNFVATESERDMCNIQKYCQYDENREKRCEISEEGEKIKDTCETDCSVCTKEQCLKKDPKKKEGEGAIKPGCEWHTWRNYCSNRPYTYKLMGGGGVKNIIKGLILGSLLVNPFVAGVTASKPTSNSVSVFGDQPSTTMNYPPGKIHNSGITPTFQTPNPNLPANQYDFSDNLYTTTVNNPEVGILLNPEANYQVKILRVHNPSLGPLGNKNFIGGHDTIQLNQLDKQGNPVGNPIFVGYYALSDQKEIESYLKKKPGSKKLNSKSLRKMVEGSPGGFVFPDPIVEGELQKTGNLKGNVLDTMTITGSQWNRDVGHSINTNDGGYYRLTSLLKPIDLLVDGPVQTTLKWIQGKSKIEHNCQTAAAKAFEGWRKTQGGRRKNRSRKNKRKKYKKSNKYLKSVKKKTTRKNKYIKNKKLKSKKK